MESDDSSRTNKIHCDRADRREAVGELVRILGVEHHLDLGERTHLVGPAREVTDELLSLLDVLVDGRFVETEYDISLRFRGSRNQRLLDVPKSLAAGQPVWWQDEKVFSTHTME